MADSTDARPRNASVFPILEAAITQAQGLLANDELASLGDEGVIFSVFLSRGEITTTTRYWIGGTGFWDVASNWTGNVLPSLTDDVIIDISGNNITTTHRSGNTQINSLLSQEAFVLSGGTLTVTEDVSLNSSYTLSGGTLRAGGTILLTGNGSWNEGTIAATEGIINTGSLAITGFANYDYKYLEGNLINQGSITHNAYYYYPSSSSNSRLGLRNLSKINNQNGATYELQEGEILAEYAATDTAFNNFGNLRKTTTNQAHIAVTFNNSGQVNVEQGNLSFSNTYTQTTGSTNLKSGSLSTSNPLNIQGGSLAGFGNVNGSVNSGGLLNPTSFGDVLIINGELINLTSPSSGSIGTLNISGNYTETSTANMNFELGGDEHTGLFDKLNIGSLATFAGTLNVSLVNGFVPQIGDRIKIITFNKYTGTLNFTGLNIGGGLQLTPLFIDGDNNGFADNLTLVVGTNQPPVANPDVVFANENTGAIFNVATLLGNDTDPENDTLTVVNINSTATKGKVTLNPDKTITYETKEKFEYLQVGETDTDTFTVHLNLVC